RFRISDGNVTYQCRFLQSEELKRNRAANRIVVTNFGTRGVPEPCRTIFHRVAAVFDPKLEPADNSLTSIFPFGDEIYALTENPVIHRVNPETLDTEGRVSVNDYVPIIVHQTAHPHIMSDGTVYNLALSLYPSGPYHSIVKFPVGSALSSSSMFEQATIVGQIPARWPLHPSYMHTFGITDQFFLIIEQPLNISLTGMVAAKLKNDPLMTCFKWYQNETTRINLISRQTGQLVHKFFSEALFYFHIINQYEFCDHVIVDICSYPDGDIVNCMYIKAMKDMQQNPDYASAFKSKPVRFVLPLKPDRTCDSLIQLQGTKAEACYLPNGEIFVK
ncbi:unnamed protein product, partial [Tenebrio molitor]